MRSSRLLTRARLQPGMRGEWTLRFSDDEFPVLLRINTADPSGSHIELKHETRDYRRGEEEVTYRVRLGWTVPPYGGDRLPRRSRAACSVHRLSLALAAVRSNGRAGFGRLLHCASVVHRQPQLALSCVL